MNSTWRVASGHKETTGAAVRVLNAGGNAFDAAVAATLAACVAEPVLCSLGGGGYALIRRAGRAPQLLDFFTQTPRRRHAGEVDFYPITGDFGPDTQEFHIGLASMATPGVVAGLFELHGRYGRLPMTEIGAPAVELARRGVILNQSQAYVLRILEPIVRASDDGARVFGLANNAGDMPAIGDCIGNPELADFMAQLMRDGARAFYQGEPAQAIARVCAQGGGHLTGLDLLGYRPRWRRPLQWRYRDARCWSNPPPAFGGMLVALATAELESRLAGDRPFGGRDHVRALVEAFLATNRLRENLEQPEHQASPRRLLQAWHQLHRRPAFSRGTTHISIRDVAGNLAGVTLSNGEGSSFVVPGTGIMLNNMLGEEDINRGGFHRWPCNRRIASMMAPVLLELGGEFSVLGTGGSNRIRSVLAQVVSNRVDFGMDLPTAVAAPRLHVEGEQVAFEAFDSGFNDDAVEYLQSAGASARAWPAPNLYFGGVHAVSDSEQAADARREGFAAAAEKFPPSGEGKIKKIHPEP